MLFISQVLSQLDAYLKGPGGEAAFVVWGDSGAGKTYIMAKLAQLISPQTSQAALIVRFLGTSPNSGEVHKLLSVLCQQMLFICERHPHADATQSPSASFPQDFQGLCGLFKKLLRDWSVCPLYLLLDSVDQLDDSNGGRRLQWLPVEADSLSPHVRLVISTLPDGESFGRKFQCLGYLRKRLRSTSRFAMVEPLRDGEDLLAHLLKMQSRRLTQQQMAAVMRVSAQSDQTQTPLFLTIVADQVKGCTSFSEVPPLSSSVKQLILSFFNSLRKHHGHRLVTKTICYLTLSLEGLSETELQELLSLDDETLLEQFEWWVPPEIVVPAASFTMLITALMPFLSPRGQNFSGELLSFYHRAFWETGFESFLSDEKHRKQVHREFVSFFRGEWAGRMKPYSDGLRDRIQKVYPGETSGDRRVRSQPFAIQGSVWGRGLMAPVINIRRCSCASFHMLQASMMHEIISEFTSFEGIVASVLCGEGFNLVSRLAEWFEMGGVSSVQDVRIMHHIFRWIKSNLHSFSMVSEILVSILAEPEASLAKRAFVDMQSQAFLVPDDLDTSLSQPQTVVDWLPRRVLWSTDTFEHLSLTLRGHDLNVNGSSWSPDNLWMVSGSSDCTLGMWETSTGKRLAKLEGHNDWVR
jgi:hypothetical protein